MDNTSAATQTDTQTSGSTLPRLFNDVHFERWEPPAPRDTTWAPFSRLPAELRLYVWQACLRRHRMIELDIWPAAEEDVTDTTYPDHDSQFPYYTYTNRNKLGNVVSGRGYVLSWSGRREQGPAGSFSPLLWVNHESRRATLGFYRVHLPFFGLQREQVLYLNPDYDIVSIQPRQDESRTTPPNPHLPTLLADFLHDVKAYDPRNQGIAHLALNHGFFSCEHTIVGDSIVYSEHFELTPSDLHPAAAASMTDILQRRLRSVLFAFRFRSCYRGQGEFPPSRAFALHFAQTIPLARRDHPAGALRWLEVDPRPGVDIDIQDLPLGEDPRLLVRGWTELEEAFGVTRPAGPRLYVCPRIRWPEYERDEDENGEGAPWRVELARHLREEDENWLRDRSFLHETMVHSFPEKPITPRHGDILDAETFERMERLPCLAIGMWMFPAEAFDKEPTNARRLCFNVSPVRPGLLLFEL
ncbi:uncharacterized protein B0T15DRAFT_252523 [Chaetomium strumarium]|uniref:2EXR domain-containing protein n=1 Tax=Chaetomium strumarium TaxID=1170767 RepID=A0AAJ0M0S0_9PEZI|nr:hypothetical protein B0T15DRAFT_252523 [Chaetomium strumarium]